ncbi:MAG: Lrp/AsnC family transcriptional regulator [Bacteroidota bacterium]
MAIKFDKTDLAILRLIQEDSRITIKEMAAQLHLSTTPIFERLKRLEKQGVIQKYVALVDPHKLGKKLDAFIHISIKDHSKNAVDEFVDQVKNYPEVMECYHVTGDSDFLLKVVLEDIDQYNRFITEKLSTVGNIGTLKSSFSLSVRKKTTAYHL